MRAEYSGELLRPNTFKAFKDGTIKISTAYMYEPYKAPLGDGFDGCMFSTKQLLKVARKAATAGMNIHIHTIGDRTLDETLDMMHSLGRIYQTTPATTRQIGAESEFGSISVHPATHLPTRQCLGPLLEKGISVHSAMENISATWRFGATCVWA